MDIDQTEHPRNESDPGLTPSGGSVSRGGPVQHGLADRQEMKREVVEFVKMIAWFLVLFFIVKTYIIEGYEVQGRSMIPTLHDRERIMVLKLPHILSEFGLFSGLNAIKEGNIVVFDSPIEKDKRYVKRVVTKGPRGRTGKMVAAGQPDASPENGVRVLYDHGTVYVNNRRIEEKYLPANQKESEDALPEAKVLAGSYYVLGDNRNESKDSRSFGPVTDEHVIGTAFVCIWPPSKIRFLR